jgi:hypothetical protein
MHTTGTDNDTSSPSDNGDDAIFIESLEAGWCVVPGEDHTLFGPACYGSVCYTTELMTACQTLNGINFADGFCLLPHRSYTVVGPVCTPTQGAVDQAPQCYGDETAQLCQEMGGTNVGDIFCILPGHHYSVLGPFCDTVISRSDEPGTILDPICVSTEEGTSACQALSGRSIGNGTFCILEDRSDYHLLGPLCQSGGACAVFDEICRSDFAGQPVGSFFCIIKGDYTMVGPASYGGLSFTGSEHLLAKNVHKNLVHDVVGDGNWYVLNGTYSVYGPTCYGSSCYQGDCVGAGGSLIGSIFCVMKMKSTTSGSFSFLPSLVVAVAIAGGLGFFLLRYSKKQDGTSDIRYGYRIAGAL